MTRAVSFALAVVDIMLAAFAALYGTLVVFVILRPWGGNLRALFFASHPDALLAFFAGVGCIVAVPLAFVSRRTSGIIWCCAFVAFQIWLAAWYLGVPRTSPPASSHFTPYILFTCIAVAIFVRFVLPRPNAVTRKV
jgi:hypothetical protein